MLRKKFLALFLIAVPVIACAAQFPSPTGYVNDFARILSNETRVSLEEQLTDLKNSSGAEISLVTVPDLGGDTVENYAVSIFKEWGIGDKGKDNGALLLIAPNEREVRLEVGYGLEGVLTDASSFWIIEKTILPEFRRGNYDLGVTKGVTEIVRILSGGEVPVGAKEGGLGFRNFFSNNFDLVPFFLVFGFSWLASVFARSKSWWAGGVVGFLVGVGIAAFETFLYAGILTVIGTTLFGLFFDYLISKKYSESISRGATPPWWAGGRGGFGGGFGGGGFGGFGGGMSGGGGASGRW